MAAGDQAALLLASLNAGQHGVEGGFVDDRAEVVVGGRIAHGKPRHALAESLGKYLINRGFDDGAGTGGTLLPAESEGRGDHALDGRVKIGVGADEDGVFSAHFEDGPLDPNLAGTDFGGALMNLQAHGFGAGECDEAGLGMLHDGVAEGRTGAGAEVHNSAWKSGFLKDLDEFGGDGGGVAGGL